MLAKSSYAVVVASQGAAGATVLFLLQELDKMLDQAWKAASPSAVWSPAPAVGDAVGCGRCGARPSALVGCGVTRGARHDVAARGVRSSRQKSVRR